MFSPRRRATATGGAPSILIDPWGGPLGDPRRGSGLDTGDHPHPPAHLLPHLSSGWAPRPLPPHPIPASTSWCSRPPSRAACTGPGRSGQSGSTRFRERLAAALCPGQGGEDCGPWAPGCCSRLGEERGHSVAAALSYWFPALDSHGAPTHPWSTPPHPQPHWFLVIFKKSRPAPDLKASEPEAKGQTHRPSPLCPAHLLT